MSTGSLLRDLSFSAFGRVAAVLLSFAMQCALAWFLHPAGRGQYAICLTFTAILVTFTTLGIDLAIGYQVASQQLTRHQGISAALTAWALSSAIAVAAGCLLMQLPIPYFEKSPRTAFYASLCWSATMIFYQSMQSLLPALRRFRFLAVLTALQWCVAVGLTYVFCAVYRFDVHGPIYANIAAGAVVMAACLGMFLAGERLAFGLPPVVSWKPLLQYGLRAWPGLLTQYFNASLGVILLSFFVDEAEIGLYAAAMMLMSQMTGIADMVRLVVTPRSAERADGHPDLVALCSRGMAPLCLLVFLGLAAFGRPLVCVCFSEHFLGSLTLMYLLMPGVFLQSCTRNTLSFFYGTGRPHIVAAASLAEFAVNLAAMFAVVPRFGLQGAAIAADVSIFVSSGLLAYNFLRLTARRPASLFVPTWGDCVGLARSIQLLASPSGRA
jgi:O-antigen/teichoic acid export membrane protein